MAGVPPPSTSRLNGSIGSSPGRSPPTHREDRAEAGPGGSPSRTRTSSTPLRSLWTLGGLLGPVPGPGPDSSATRPRGQSHGSALSSRTRTLGTQVLSHPAPVSLLAKCMMGVLVKLGQRLMVMFHPVIMSAPVTTAPGGARGPAGPDPGVSGSETGGPESQPQPAA